MNLGAIFKKLGLTKRHLLFVLFSVLLVSLTLVLVVTNNSQFSRAENKKGAGSAAVPPLYKVSLPLANGKLVGPKEKSPPEISFSNVGSPASIEVKSEDKSIKFTVLQPESLVAKDVGPILDQISTGEKTLINPRPDQDINLENKVYQTLQAPAIAEDITKKDNQTTIKVNDSLDLEYQVIQNSSVTMVKETAIIKDASSLSADPNYHLAFNMDLNGLDPVKNQDGSYSLRDKNGLTSMSISAPTIEDSDKKIGQISLDINKDNSLATFVIDPAFVDSAKFPLYLDPTVTIATSTTSNPNSYSKDRTLFEATNGDMINIYSAGAEVDYKISTDKGNTWGSATKIIDSSLTDDTGFSGWITADNKIHLTYSNNNTNSYIFYRQLTYATASHTITSLGTEYTVESAGTSQSFPTVATKSNGTIFVAYQYYDGANYTIKVKASTATDGSTWSVSTTLSAATNASAATYPAITLWNDNPAVIYNFADASLRWNYYNGSAWQAAGWTNETIASDVGAALNQEFSISQTTSDNYMHLAWKDDSVGIKYRKNANAAAGWDGASTAITTGGNHANDKNPSIGLGQNDAIFLYYSEYVGANSYNIKYQEKVGSAATFGSAIAVTIDNGNNLIAQAGLKPTATNSTGQTNYAITMNGSTQYGSVPAAVKTGLTTFTVSIWVKTTENRTNATYWNRPTIIGEASNGSASGDFGIVTNNGYIGMWSGLNSGGDNSWLSVTKQINDNNWHHILVTNDGATATLYADGSSQGTISTGLALDNGAFFIGAENALGTQNYFHQGTYDELEVYNRSLSTAEISVLYNSGVQRQAYGISNLVGGWAIDENTGTVISDYSGSGYNGSLFNTPTWVSAPAKSVYYAASSAAKLNYSPVVLVSGVGSPYNLDYAPTVKTWSAAADGNWETAGNWTPSGAPAAGDMVVFDATSTKNCTVTTYTAANGIVDNLGGLYLNSGYSGTVNFQKKPSQNADPFKINIAGDFIINSGTVTTEGDVTVSHSGVTDGRGNEFDEANLTIGANGNFNANGKGFAVSTGPGYDSGFSAAYGGDSAVLGKTYGDFANPVSLGSGGASGVGGGAVAVSASQNISVAGIISAAGTATGSGNNSGSGGTVNLVAGGTLSGAGSISANSVAGNTTSGGGGRVKLAATTISFNGTLSASGKNNSSAGTVYKIATGTQAYGDLIINNGTNTPGLTNQAAAHLKASTDTGSYQFDSITYLNYGRLMVDAGQTVAIDTATVTGDKNSGFINAGTVTAPASWTIGYLFSDKNGTVTSLSGKTITISSAGCLTHYPNTTAETYKLNWTVSTLTVQSGGEINTNGLGYADSIGPGYTSGVGASYGGEGYGANVSKVYGDYSNPVNLGSGGRGDIFGGAPGGGAIILNVTNTMDIMGTISANGVPGVNGGGASGGSINLSAVTISNSGGGGSITANGGNGGTTVTGYGGGGGGRVKLVGTTLSYSGALTAKGGAPGGATNGPGSAGTILRQTAAQTYGDLIINNTGNAPALYQQAAAHLKASTDASSYQFDSITCSNYGRLVVDASQTLALESGTITGDKNSGFVNAGTVTTPASWTIGYMFSDKNGTVTNLAAKTITISSAGRLTHYPNYDTETYKLNWTVNTLTVQASGEINTNGTGYAGAKGPGYTSGSVGSSYGGEGYGAAGSKVYGDYSNPVNLGSGGWAGNYGFAPGGGAILLSVTNTLDVMGTISANGVPMDMGYGGASGGSINLSAATISNSGGGGSITANGGNGGGYGMGYGGGSGGRVKLAGITLSYSGTLTAKGGAHGYATNGSGSAGTILRQTAVQTYGDLIINNGANGATTSYTPLTAPKSFDSVAVSSYGQFRLDINADASLDTLTVTGDITLTSNAIVILMSDADGTPAKGTGMAVTATNISVASGTVIQSNATGFIHDSGYSNGKGLVAATRGGGGAFGGAGGNSNDGGLGGQVYGAAQDVLYVGSGGGAANLGGAGGGLISMNITGVLTNAGTISVNGANGATNGGGGAGGGLQIFTSTCSSTGTISANGGNGAANAGGGGGGRIYIRSTGTCPISPVPTATGGTGANNGSNGTVTTSITISGRIYTDEGKTGDIGSGKTVALTLNGVASTPVQTTSNGNFSFTNQVVTLNQPVAVYVSGDAQKASLITLPLDASSSITGLELFTVHVVLTHLSAGPMTNALLSTANTIGDSDMLISTSGGNTTFTTGNKLWIISSKTYTPGGGVIADDIKISGTFTMAANAVTVHGSWDGTGGAFSSSSIVTFDASSTGETIISDGDAFSSVTFNNAAGGWQFQDTTSITGNLTITNSETAGLGVNFNNQAINIDGNFQMDAGKLTMGSSAVTAGGNWTINGGTQTPNTSTVTFDAGAAGKTIKSSSQSFNNVIFNNAAGSWDFQDDMRIAGNFSQQAGTFTANSSTVDFTKSAGTQTVSASSSFNNLSHSGAGTLQVVDAGDINSQKITIDKSMVAHAVEASQTDFPVLIRLADEANSLFTTARSDGADIHFTNNVGTEIPFEVEKYVPTAGLRELIAWVKISSLSSAANTDIYVKYGGGVFSHDATQVWSNGYVGVWHMPNGSSLTTNNSASSSYNVTSTGGIAAAPGVIDGGAYFDGGISHYLYISDNLSALDSASTFTISLWINPTNSGTSFFSKQNPSHYTNDLLFVANTSTSVWLQVDNGADGTASYSTTSLIGRNTYLVAVYDGTQTGNANRLKIYENGTQKTLSFGAYTVPATTANMSGFPQRFGRYDDNNDWKIAGLLDEARISSSARSADWTATTYNNQNAPASYLTYGAAISPELTVAGNFSNSNGIFDLNGKTINIAGNYANTATFTANSGTVNMNAATAGKTLSGTLDGSSAFYNLTFNNAAGGWSFSNAVRVANNLTITTSETAGNGVDFNNQSIDVNGNLSLAAGKLTSDSSAVSLAGNFAHSGGTFVPNTSNYIFDGADASTQAISGTTTFNNFTATTAANAAGRTLQFAGNSATTVSGTWNITGYSGKVITLQSSDTNAWTITPTAASVTYTTVSRSTNTGVTFCATYSTDGLNNTNWHFAAADICSGAITISGTFYTAENKSTNISSGHNIGLSVNGAAKTTVASGASGTFAFSTITVSPNQTLAIFIDDDGTYEGTLITLTNDFFTNITGLEGYTNKVVLRHENAGPVTNAQLVTARTTGDSDIHYTNPSGSNITFDAGFETWIDTGKTYTPGAAVIADDYDINGTFTMGVNAVTVHSNWDATGGVFTSSGTITFDASTTGKTIISNGQHFNNVTFNNAAGSWSFADSANIDGNFLVTNSETAGNGVNLNNQAIDVNGNVQIDAGKLTAGSSLINIAGNWTRAGGTFVANTSGITFDASSSIKTIASGSQPFNNVTFNDAAGTAIFRPVDALDINGTFTLTDGILDLNTFDPTLHIAGNITIGGGSITKSNIGSPVTFDGDLSYSDNVGTSNFGAIAIGTSPDTTTLESNMVCDSLLINAGDVLITQGYDIDSADNIRIIGTLNATHNGAKGGDSAINLAGDWDATGGAFTADTSTVTLDGATAQSITSDSKSFNNLTTTNASVAGTTFTDGSTLSGTFANTTQDSKVTFNAGSTYAFNIVNVAGNAGHLVTFVSSVPGTTWLFNVTEASPTAYYVSATDSNASGGSAIDATIGGFNGGGNTNWLFAVASVSITPLSVTLDQSATQAFSATAADAEGYNVPFATFVWSAVAGGGSISPAGLFTAGTTAGTFSNTVQATSGGVNGFASVTVSAIPTPPTPPTPPTTPPPSGDSCNLGSITQVEIQNGDFSTAPGQVTTMGINFLDAAGNPVHKDSVTNFKMTPDYSSSYWDILNGGGRLDSENQDTININFIGGGTRGTFNNTIIFSACGGALKAYATPTINKARTLYADMQPGSYALQPGESFNFSVSLFDDTGATANDSCSYSWSLSNPSAATLGSPATSATRVTANNAKGEYILKVDINCNGQSLSAESRLAILTIDANTEWKLTSYFPSLTSWVGQRTYVPFMPYIKVGSSWYSRAEKVDYTFSDPSAAKVVGLHPTYPSIPIVEATKEGCYPMLVQATLNQFGKSYTSATSMNIGSSDLKSDSQYKPNLGSSILSYQHVVKRAGEVAFTLGRRDALGNSYSNYNWIYFGKNMTTDWIVNDTRVGSFRPYYDLSYLDTTNANYGYYPRALTTVVNFNGQKKTENWDIWIERTSDKITFSPSVPDTIRIKPNSYFRGVWQGYRYANWNEQINAVYKIKSLNADAVSLINGVDAALLFKSGSKEGTYPDAIVVSSAYAATSMVGGTERKITVIVDNNATADLCSASAFAQISTTDNSVNPGESANTNTDVTKSISDILKDIWNAIAAAIANIFKWLNNNPLFSLIISFLLALPALISILGISALGDVLTSIIRFFSALTFAAIGGKKNRRLGYIYDYLTKKPIRGAKVSAFAIATNRAIYQTVTNSQGEFVLYLPHGEYYLKVEKKGYGPYQAVPAEDRKHFDGRRTDGYYESIYLPSETLSISQGQEDFAHAIAIPLMRPMPKENLFITFLVKLGGWLVKASFYFLIIGTIMTIGLLIYDHTNKVNIIIGIYYILVWTLFTYRHFTFFSGTAQVVNESGTALDLALIRVINDKGKMIQTVVSDRRGHFILNLAKGDYSLRVSKADYEIKEMPLHVKHLGDINRLRIILH